MTLGFIYFPFVRQTMSDKLTNAECMKPTVTFNTT